jgi:hypothetical protein
MARTWTEKVWEEYECYACGSVFRFLARRRLRLDRAGREKPLPTKLTPRPCPACGGLQPDYVGGRLERAHTWFLVVALVGTIFFLVLTNIEGAFRVPKNVALWIACGLAAVVLAGHFLISCFSFQGRREANRALADKLAAKKALVLCRRGDEVGVETLPVHLPGAGWALAGFLLVLLMIPTAEWFRLARGWHWNWNCDPGVAGPLDTPVVWLPQKIEAVKGYWNGIARVQVLNAAELGLVQDTVSAQASSDQWAGTLTVERRERNKITSLWVRPTVPDVASPDRKILRLKIELDVQYPTLRNLNQDVYVNLRSAFSHTAELVLASPRAGKDYELAWWIGVVAGTAFMLVCGVVLIAQATHMRKQGGPIRIIPLEDDDD